jgi:hypothetical protein
MQILIVHQDFGFVLLTYSKFVLYFCIVHKCDYKLQISKWICSYCKLIPTFEHYECIANAFAWLLNLAPSAVFLCECWLSEPTHPHISISDCCCLISVFSVPIDMAQNIAPLRVPHFTWCSSGKRGDSDKAIYSLKMFKISIITIRITYHQIKLD